jgi:hypothetical protein
MVSSVSVTDPEALAETSSESFGELLSSTGHRGGSTCS